jgi:hypothetical protein
VVRGDAVGVGCLACARALETDFAAEGSRLLTVAAPAPEVDTVVVATGWVDGPLAAERVVIVSLDDPGEVDLLALFADGVDPPADEVSAWATPDPLARAAPTPRVIAPAPSHAYGSR